MDLSIVIVNWNTRELLAKCLESVYAYRPKGEFEVIVVDNASSDASASMVRDRFPEVVLLETGENVGFARGINHGIRVSQAEHILLLNSDAELLPETCQRLLEVVNNESSIGMVGARILNTDGTFQASFNDFPTIWSEAIQALGLAKQVYGPYHPSHDPKEANEGRLCDWVPGACFLVRSAAIDDVGLLDESFFMYSEEVDWARRMWNGGWQVYYCADAAVLHWGGKSADPASERQLGLLYSSKVKYFRKHHGPVVAAMLGFIIRLAALLKSSYWLARWALNPDNRSYRLRMTSHYAVASRLRP